MQGAAPRPGSEGSTRGVRARLKVSKNSRTPQFNLIPLEPGPAGPRKLRMAATRAQGDSQPRSPPAVPPLCSHTTAPGRARCPALIYLGVGAFLTFPSPQLWGSWAVQAAGFGAVQAAGFRAVPAAFWVQRRVRQRSGAGCGRALPPGQRHRRAHTRFHDASPLSAASFKYIWVFLCCCVLLLGPRTPPPILHQFSIFQRLCPKTQLSFLGAERC